uniref:Dihydrolipoyllysine-residue acetyltransferase component of pyruvatedehydrogenase complex n=1 Tax=Arundo donax TaxID=35708 RepID=A0A0A8XPS9_ARUDO
MNNLSEVALFHALHLHGGFISFHLAENLTRGDLVSLLLKPLGNVPLSHCRGERRHPNFLMWWEVCTT